MLLREFDFCTINLSINVYIHIDIVPEQTGTCVKSGFLAFRPGEHYALGYGAVQVIVADR